MESLESNLDLGHKLVYLPHRIEFHFKVSSGDEKRAVQLCLEVPLLRV